MNMLALDFSNHRIIAMTICLSVILLAVIAILIRYFVHRGKRLRQSTKVPEKKDRFSAEETNDKEERQF